MGGWSRATKAHQCPQRPDVGFLDFFTLEEKGFREAVIAVFKYLRVIREKMMLRSPQQCTVREQGATFISCENGNSNGK